MRIVSTFLPAREERAVALDRPAVVCAFDTLVDQKSLVVGITVGRVSGPDLSGVMFARPLGQIVLERCSAHHHLNYPDSAVVLVAGVATVGNAVKRVRQVLAHAPEHALVMLLCADDKVYDAAFDALGIDLQSAKQDPQ